MPRATYRKYQLHFKNPVLTSRGELKVKNGYFLEIHESGKTGIGECSFIEGLSIDKLDRYEEALDDLCKDFETDNGEIITDLEMFPSIAFAVECAFLDYQNGGRRIIFPGDFVKGNSPIPINGLVWMGKKNFMHQQIRQKLRAGFRCIKIKVGAIDFTEEANLLKSIRNEFDPTVTEIRLDANGAFTGKDVFGKLEALAKYGIHSIEQPVKAGQYNLMKEVCSKSPIPVALDEELIGMPANERNHLLSWMSPHHIILKPSILGGFAICNKWIDLAESKGIGWWVTSALESNIGLSALAQWVSTKENSRVHGLGTGELYKNNIPSPLFISNGCLGYNPNTPWGSLENLG
jgi:o-succinylbenzoate synthase